MDTKSRLPELNIEEIRRYNENLRITNVRAAQAKAEVQLTTGELQRLCRELSEDLGIEVTPENVKDVYVELVNRINNNLQVGLEILGRINQQTGIGEGLGTTRI